MARFDVYKAAHGLKANPFSFNSDAGLERAGFVEGPGHVTLMTLNGTRVNKLRVPKSEATPYDSFVFDASEAVEVAKEGKHGLSWHPTPGGK